MRKQILYSALTALGGCMLTVLTSGQTMSSSDSAITAAVSKASGKYVGKLSDMAGKTTASLQKQTDRYLDRLEKEERHLYKLVAKKDSLAALRLYNDGTKKYTQLKSAIAQKAERLRRPLGKYFPWADTAAVSLQLLTTGKFAKTLPVSPAEVNGALAKVKDLQGELNQADNIKEFIRQRNAVLTDALNRYNLSGELKKYNATAYYYGQQVQDIQSAFDDPSKAEQKALSLLRQYGPFKELLQKNGMLAGLFNTPTGDASQPLPGQQTVAQVQELVSRSVGLMGPNGRDVAGASLASAQAMLAQVRSKLPPSGDARDIQGFTPDRTKTKPLSKRMVYGFDMQTSRGNSFIPNYTDLALSAGLQLTDHFTFSLGMSYKLGFGKDIRHIEFSSEGLGVRSSVDFRLKKSLFITGGLEANYLNRFSSIKELQEYSAWKQSALIGFSKTVALKTRVLKNTKVSLLFDLLHATQVPRTDAIKFRCGYNL